jgi:hypothetical protein
MARKFLWRTYDCASKAIPKHSVKTKFQGMLIIRRQEKIAFFIRFGWINIAVLKPNAGYSKALDPQALVFADAGLATRMSQAVLKKNNINKQKARCDGVDKHNVNRGRGFNV